MAYALLGFMDTRFWYLHNYRALPMFGLPLLLFAADEMLRGIGWLADEHPEAARASSDPDRVTADDAPSQALTAGLHRRRCAPGRRRSDRRTYAL